VDTATAQRWCAAAADGSLGAARRVLQAFRAACHLGDTADDPTAGGGSRLRIMSDAAFQRVLVFALTEADGILRRLLGLSKDALLTEAIIKTAKYAAAARSPVDAAHTEQCHHG
jgi:nucleolar complex protein 2